MVREIENTRDALVDLKDFTGDYTEWRVEVISRLKEYEKDTFEIMTVDEDINRTVRNKIQNIWSSF